MRRPLIIMTFLAISVNVLTPSFAPAKEPPSSAAGKTAPGGIPSLPSLSQHYVHRWLAFPQVSGRNPTTDEVLNFSPQPGRALVVIFLASWCLPCQQLSPQLKELENKYSKRYTDIVYVFAHDTEPDARGFLAAHKLGPNTILGSAALLERFHQPELPSIYLADRYGWLVHRALNATLEDIKEIDRFLELHTSF